MNDNLKESNGMMNRLIDRPRLLMKFAGIGTARAFVLSLALALALCGCGHGPVHQLPRGSTEGLVPLPVRVEMGSKEATGFRSDGKLRLSWPEGWPMDGVTQWLTQAGMTWEVLPTKSGESGNSSQDQPGVWMWRAVDEDLGEEGYRLTVGKDRVIIESRDAEGGFRGWTTLRQMLPPLCESGCPAGFVLPEVFIEDWAELKHRGLLLDCCRHMMEPSFVKQVIDALSLQKMNVLHWHLTEDQGWRIPIPAYPKLTEIGGFRTEEDGTVTGGFYTKQEIQEIVRYAADRHVQIIPEIEMPGHCRAALAAYPWLGCTGETMDVPNNWGVFKDVYCAGQDTTLSFMRAVLDEVCTLFPSEVIHIGGDEVPRVRWEDCERCQSRMADLGFTDESQLQTYFINQMGAHLSSKGRRIMGWDEILEGGLPEGAMVQSWRGMQGAVEATHLGTDVVVSPTSHCYLDYPLRSIDLEKVYGFNPIPEEAQGQLGRVLGGECNMWTERAPQDQVMGKVFPRATGLAEVLWSGTAVTLKEGAYDRFLTRLDGLAQRWAHMGLEPGLEGVPVALSVQPHVQGTVEVAVEPALRHVGGDVTFVPDDESEPVAEGRVGGSLLVSGLGEVRVDVSMRGRATGVTERFPVAGHVAAHQPLELSYTPSPHYTGGGPQALADGRRGSMDFRDGAWQAVQGSDMSCTVDLGEVHALSRVETQLYLYQDAWIFMPSHVMWSVSTDGIRFVDLPSQAPWGLALERDGRQTVVPVGMDLGGLRARYVRMHLVNPGPCPTWHDAASEPTWLFVDEFVVKGMKPV
ncbi:MAG: family 20 glycosylhydrolase [Bacteroidetes bacterium]|nr:family 20 glycosylhydrolase [Bacteroidota bacterium]